MGRSRVRNPTLEEPNAQRLIDASCVDSAVHYLKELEKTFGKNYAYARGFRDCLIFLELTDDEENSHKQEVCS